MRIQSNVNTSQYQNSVNHMKATEEQQKKSAKELSTGKKVNGAADDAVALAISKQIEKEVNSLNQGSKNISYGIDATNIADGALSNITDSLGDIEQNTVRAMNGLYSESDRAILQKWTVRRLQVILQFKVHIAIETVEMLNDLTFSIEFKPLMCRGCTLSQDRIERIFVPQWPILVIE